MATALDLTEQNLDLTACDREPIHIPGSIQPHGVLFVLEEPRFSVFETSVNTEELLGIVPERVLGSTLTELFGLESGHNIEVALRRSNLTSNTNAGQVWGPLYLLTVSAPSKRRFFHVVAHRFEGELILELESSDSPGAASFQHLYPIVSTLVGRLKTASGVEAIARFAAQEVRRLTAFDRVLVYRFDDAWNGQVIGEARDESYASYFHLWFPASDIPQQARKLYELNRLRLISDVRYRPVGLMGRSPRERPLNLSFVSLRSVSPVHIEYLKNMGVGSSMSMSLLTDDGRLWGLIACHHRKPKFLSLEIKTACDLLAQTVSTQLEVAEQRQKYERRFRLTSVTTRLLGFMAQEDEFLDGLINHPDEILGFGEAEGVAIVHSGDCIRLGACPEESEILKITDWLLAQGRQDVFCTDRLPALIPGGDSLRDVASGFLAISISKLYRSYILWFRPEVVRTVDWSGDPRKPVQELDGVPERLHPRKSFEIWKETVRGRSLPWHLEQIEVAGELRNAILGIVLKRAEELAEVSAELQRSNKELEAFSYSVSHDLRAPFRHILGYSELLKSSTTAKLDANDTRYIDVIIEAAGFAGTLVENLLNFSRLGRAKLTIRNLDMNALVSEARHDLSAEQEGRKITWQVGALPDAQADGILLRLVWQNLLQNALKYSNKRDRAIIEIGAREEDAEKVFWVKDNGVGFEQAYADKLFGVFQRLHRAEDFAGTGIGLANVKRIISRHGGRVWAQGELDRGATFFFSLPKAGSEPANS